MRAHAALHRQPVRPDNDYWVPTSIPLTPPASPASTVEIDSELLTEAGPALWSDQESLALPAL